MAVSRIEFGSLVFATTYDFGRMERNFCKVAGIYQGQPRILTILNQNQGVTLSELSPLCNIGMPSLSVSLRNMQKAGLVRKEGTGKHQKLYLTDAGKEQAQLFHQQIDGFYAQFLETIGSEAAQQLQDSMALFDCHLKRFNEEFQQEHGWK